MGRILMVCWIDIWACLYIGIHGYIHRRIFISLISMGYSSWYLQEQLKQRPGQKTCQMEPGIRDRDLESINQSHHSAYPLICIHPGAARVDYAQVN